MTNEEAMNTLVGLMKSKNLTVQVEHKFAYAWCKNYYKLISISKVIENNRYPKTDKEDEKYMKEVSKIDEELKLENLPEKEHTEKRELLVNQLEEKYPKVKEKWDKHREFFDNFMKQEVEFTPYMVLDVEQIPPMTLEQRAGCNFFLPGE